MCLIVSSVFRFCTHWKSSRERDTHAHQNVASFSITSGKQSLSHSLYCSCSRKYTNLSIEKFNDLSSFRFLIKFSCVLSVWQCRCSFSTIELFLLLRPTIRTYVCINLRILRFDAPTSVDCNFIEVEAEEAEKGKKPTGKKQLKIMFLVLLAPQPILVSSSMLLFCFFFLSFCSVYLCRHSFPFHTILFSLNFNFSYLFLTTYSAYLPIFSNVFI